MNIIQNFSIEHIIAVLLVVILLVIAYVLYIAFTIKNRLRKAEVFTNTVEATERLGRLESSFATQSQQLQKALDTLTSHDQRLARVQHTELRRYNPFKESGVGGNQSFTSAFVDEKGDGLIITSLYSRETTRVTGKEIKQWQSQEAQCSVEELEVLDSLKKKL